MKFLHSLTGNESAIVTGHVLKNGMKEITNETADKRFYDKIRHKKRGKSNAGASQRTWTDTRYCRNFS